MGVRESINNHTELLSKIRCMKYYIAINHPFFFFFFGGYRDIDDDNFYFVMIKYRKENGFS